MSRTSPAQEIEGRAIHQFILLISNRNHDYPKQETYLDSRKHPGMIERPTNAHIYDLIFNEVPSSKTDYVLIITFVVI